MPRRTPGLLLSLALLTAGLLSCYYVLRANGWNNQTNLVEVWNHLPVQFRLLVVISWGAAAYGTGGILNWLLTRWRPR